MQMLISDQPLSHYLVAAVSVLLWSPWCRTGDLATTMDYADRGYLLIVGLEFF